MSLYPRGFNGLQKLSMSLMTVLALITFIASNLHAILWQSSEWLVSTILPAVVVDLTNEERVENAAAPLVRNETLDEAARLKAEDMAKHEYFAHYSPEGVSPWHWFDEVGYVYAHAGENLAIHFTDSSEVVEAWMNSPAHRENIVGQQYTEIGVGTAKGTYEGYETVYVVQLFGTPAIPPVSNPARTTTPEQKPIVALIPEVEPDVVPGVEAIIVPAEETINGPETEAAARVAAVTETANIESADAVSLAELKKEKETTPVVTISSNGVVVESPLIATSSGLAVAQVITPNYDHAGHTVASIVTQPNIVLQYTYYILGTVVVLLLVSSIALEARRFRFTQVVYGILLLVGMSVLWYTHALLTSGAVVT